MTFIGSNRAAEILDVTPRMVQRYVEMGRIVPAKRTKGGFAKFDEDYIYDKAEEFKWRGKERTSRGSRGGTTESPTPIGTTQVSDDRIVKVSTLAILSKRPSGSADSSLKARPSLAEMLD